MYILTSCLQSIQYIAIILSSGGGVFITLFVCRPTIAITPGASKINGLFMRKGNLVKRKHGGEVELLSTVEIPEGLQQFFDWANSQAEVC